jgi:hypothetical protein
VDLSSAQRQRSYIKYARNNDQNKKQETSKSIDVATSADKNIVQKEAEKHLECKSLWIETQQMWNKKCRINPVIYSANRTLKVILRKNIESHSRKTFNRFHTKKSFIWNITQNM